MTIKWSIFDRRQHVFFIAVQKMINSQGTGPGYLQQIMDIPMSDAATLHRELSH